MLFAKEIRGYLLGTACHSEKPKDLKTPVALSVAPSPQFGANLVNAYCRKRAVCVNRAIPGMRKKIKTV